MATELDKLIVKIEADLSGLKRDMAQVNKIVGKSTSNVKKQLVNMGVGFTRLGASITKFGVLAGTVLGGVFLKSVVDVGLQIESLEIRLKALFGSAEEGARAFDVMLKFAGQVPFSLQEIQNAAGNLAVVSDDADELGNVLKITGNVAAVTGLSFQQTAEQIQRSFAGGIAAADVFRERGVRNMLGFKAGATVTAEETIAAFQKAFGEGGEFGNVTNELANTLGGTLTMIKDKFFAFQKAVAEGFFAELQFQFTEFDLFLAENEEKIAQIGKNIGKSIAEFIRVMADNIETIKNFFIALAGAAVLGAIGSLIIKLKALKDILIVTAALMRAHPAFAIIGLAVSAGIGLAKLTSATKDLREEAEKTKQAIADNVMKGLSDHAFHHITGKKIQEQKLKEQKAAERAAKKAEKARLEAMQKQFILRAQINQVEMDRIAEIRGAAFDEEQEQLDKIMKKFEEVGQSISDAFGKALISGKDFKDSMVDIFQSILQQVTALIFQLYVIQPLLKEIEDSINKSRTGGGSSGFVSQALGFLTGGIGSGSGHIDSGSNLGSAHFGTRQYGGNVNPNMPYMVGERGAELFMPKSAGTIIPNGQMGGGIVVEQNLNFATGVSETVQAEVLNLLPTIQQSTLQVVQEARLRGGRFAKDFGA